MLHKDALQLKEELRELFRERCTKPQLLQHVAEKLSGFPHLRNTIFQKAINEFIVIRAEEDCEIILHEDEIKAIWD